MKNANALIEEYEQSRRYRNSPEFLERQREIRKKSEKENAERQARREAQREAQRKAEQLKNEQEIKKYDDLFSKFTK